VYSNEASVIGQILYRYNTGFLLTWKNYWKLVNLENSWNFRLGLEFMLVLTL